MRKNPYKPFPSVSMPFLCTQCCSLAFQCWSIVLYAVEDLGTSGVLGFETLQPLSSALGLLNSGTPSFLELPLYILLHPSSHGKIREACKGQDVKKSCTNRKSL